MTNLYPGMLFYSSGLNKKSTPLPPEATPSEIDHKLSRVPFNGRPWPKSSPVSHVYDVRNSSTRMIILNNKLSRKPKGSRLRGQTDHQGEIERPEPFRHTSDEPHTNWHHHKKCGTSVSEKFVPIFPPGMSPLPEWVNKTQRPAMKFDNGSGVNPNHHIQCQGHMDYDIVRWYDKQRRPRSRTSSSRESRALSPILRDPTLSKGERQYLNHIAKIYSVDNMRTQKQLQYNELMWSEIRKGKLRPSDWEKYYRYLNTPRKTQYGPCDPSRQSRSISAPGRRKNDDNEESRPPTTQTGAKRSSRGPPSTGASTSRSTQDQRRGQRHQGQKGTAGRKKDPLVGKPARVESPLPMVPRRDSLSSLSSIEDEADGGKGNKGKLAEHPSDENDTGRGVQEKRVGDETRAGKKHEDKEKEEERAEAYKGKDDDIDKRMEDDDDERSKMSARDSERYADNQGHAISYHPTLNERVEEDEERSGNERSSPKGDQENQKEQYRRKEEEKTTADENAVVTLPGVKVDKGNSDNNGSGDDAEKGGKVDDSDDLDTGPKLIHHIHKEGGDRPLSRLGGRGQFTLVKKDNAANSDDDYSDDEEEVIEKNDEIKDDFLDEVKAESNAKGSSPKGGAQENENKTEPRFKLAIQGDKNESNGVDKTKDSNPQPTSPTEASSQEKPSTITTLEY